MSARQTFVYCHDCNALNYGVPDKNGVAQRDSVATNCWGHNVHVFGDPVTYQPPICHALTKLHAGFPLTDWEIWVFKLACSLGELEDHRRIPAEEGLARLQDQMERTRGNE
ncbi:MAG: hypothetical protein Q4B10_03290 [Actinomycetaceae bacterium]|nr:hypothetical protein [Actinomycetaceae bacterium]